MMEEKSAYEIVGQMDFFRGFSPPEIDQLLATGRWVRAVSGEAVIAEGAEDPCPYLYVLVRGKVNVVKNKKVLAVLGVGDTFGEIGAMADTPRSAHVIANGECFLLRFDPSQINDLPTELQLKFVKRLLYTLAGRLVAMDRRVCLV